MATPASAVAAGPQPTQDAAVIDEILAMMQQSARQEAAMQAEQAHATAVIKEAQRARKLVSAKRRAERESEQRKVPAHPCPPPHPLCSTVCAVRHVQGGTP